MTLALALLSGRTFTGVPSRTAPRTNAGTVTRTPVCISASTSEHPVKFACRETAVHPAPLGQCTMRIRGRARQGTRSSEPSVAPALARLRACLGAPYAAGAAAPPVTGQGKGKVARLAPSRNACYVYTSAPRRTVAPRCGVSPPNRQLCAPCTRGQLGHFGGPGAPLSLHPVGPSVLSSVET